MSKKFLVASSVVLAALVLSGSWLAAQTSGIKEDFTATAITNNEFGAGANVVQIQVTRWSTESERTKLVNALVKNGPDDLLKELMRSRSVGIIKTPDSLGYDLRYASQTPGEDGGRRIVLATDRPIGFWEATRQPRTINYPFTVIQMQLDRDGKGKGTLSYATKITARGNTIERENFATAATMLTNIEAHPHKD
jgi:hypothetical protein